MGEASVLHVDGSQGEGGGQILRTALSLSVLLGRSVQFENIRAARPKPGLRPQHLVAVRAAARISDAELQGDRVGSQTLLFAPQRPPLPGDYTFDVGATEAGGSAGATSLVFQTLLLPLSWAPAPSELTLVGGTHVPWSPPAHYLAHVFLPMVARLGLSADLSVERWGWYPKGGGVVHVTVNPREEPAESLLQLDKRGKLVRIWGFSAVSNLPEHIIERQKRSAAEVLRKAGLKADIEEFSAPSIGQGTALFLVAEYEQAIAGFVALGALRKPAEKVGEEAAKALVKFHRSKAAVEPHLADQLLPAIAACNAEASFTTSELTPHLTTNAWVIEQFFGPLIDIQPLDKGAQVFVRRRREHV
jgi:RNA 3'-terminal phosphate cyclase (ATP)